MKLTSTLTAILLLPALRFASAIPNPHPAPTRAIITATDMPGGPLPTAVTTTIYGSDDYITKCYTTTLTSLIRGEFIGLSIMSLITTETVSTIQPVCRTYPTGVVLTVS